MVFNVVIKRERERDFHKTYQRLTAFSRKCLKGQQLNDIIEFFYSVTPIRRVKIRIDLESARKPVQEL
jgi:hypothetical protein